MILINFEPDPRCQLIMDPGRSGSGTLEIVFVWLLSAPSSSLFNDIRTF